MSRTSHPSPCCKVRSEVLRISLQRQHFIVACTRCGAVRVVAMKGACPLKLVVNR